MVRVEVARVEMGPWSPSTGAIVIVTRSRVREGCDAPARSFGVPQADNWTVPAKPRQSPVQFTLISPVYGSTETVMVNLPDVSLIVLPPETDSAVLVLFDGS
jgi:hypothetical protein